ncbi:MAG: hypothetical protein HFJ36_03905 [Clostridia bacterium]|nr:hypothetical protein [Clostridia bacterium]
MEENMKNEILMAIQGVNIKVDYIQKEVAKIPEMQKQITEMQKEVAKIPEIQKEVVKIPEMQKQITEMQKEVAKIPEIQKEVAKIPEMQKQIAEMQKEIRSISRSVAIIEYEHGDKLKALFDAFTMTKEKIEEQEKINLVHEKKIEKHDLEINYLTAQIQGA